MTLKQLSETIADGKLRYNTEDGYYNEGYSALEIEAMIKAYLANRGEDERKATDGRKLGAGTKRNKGEKNELQD